MADTFSLFYYYGHSIIIIHNESQIKYNSSRIFICYNITTQNTMRNELYACKYTFCFFAFACTCRSLGT